MSTTTIPADLAAERQVIGALILRPDLMVQVAFILRSEDFHLEAHRLLFQAVNEHYRDGEIEFDPLQVINYLRDRSLLEKAGGGSYILKTVQDVVAPENAPVHARRIRNLSIRRFLIKEVQGIEADASRPHDDENQFLRSVEERILSVTNRTHTQDVIPISSIQRDFHDYIEKLMEAKGGLSGTPTCFDEFDNLTSGLRGGELIVLAARPGMGKTTFAMNIAANMAMINQSNILIFSLEMSRMELLLRMLCAKAQVNLSDIKRGRIPETKVQTVLDSIEVLFASPMYIDDSGALDIWECMTRTRKLAVDLKQKGKNIDLVVIDYLQLMTDPESRKHGRQNEVASISRGLKQLAKMVEAPILALSQMNRSVEQRRGDSARPQLSDLRESGAIEQDADIVMFIHQEFIGGEPDSHDNMDQHFENKGTAEIIIAKHRNGPVGNFRLNFRPEINRFDTRPPEDDNTTI